MAAVKAGGDRQVLHEVIREHSLAAWAELQAGVPIRWLVAWLVMTGSRNIFLRCGLESA